MNQGLKLPVDFSICCENKELLKVHRHDSGEFVGEVVNYFKYFDNYTTCMVWRNKEIIKWMEDRTIPQARISISKSLSRLEMDHWDLEELMVRTRGIRMPDFLWLRFDPNEKIEDMHPRFHEDEWTFIEL